MVILYLFEHICSFNQPDVYFLIPIVVVLTMLLISCIYDLKLGIIPNHLSKLLIVFGIIYSFILAVIFSNIYFLINSIILGLIIFIISLLLWKIRFWGGGDLKLFVGMAITLAYFSSPLFISLNCLSYMNQDLFYFPIISILFNSILISFPFILVYLFIKYLNENFNLICKNLEEELELKNKNNYYFIIVLGYQLIKLFIFNINKIIHSSSQKKIQINNLKEGMILDNYYFNDVTFYNIVNLKDYDDSKYPDLSINQEFNNYINLNINVNNLNLSSKVFSNSFSYESEGIEKSLYYIKSSNGAGLTKEDIQLINYCFENKIIKNKEFLIKIGIPFSPSLLFGFIIFLFYGDLIHVISQFLINLI